jgi:hypothetical protein
VFWNSWRNVERRSWIIEGLRLLICDTTLFWDALGPMAAFEAGKQELQIPCMGNQDDFAHMTRHIFDMVMTIGNFK